MKMDLNRERLSEQEIQEKILEINQKIDEELLNPEGTDMALVDEYFRQIRELDGMPETSEAELKSELQLLYKKAGLQQKRKSPWMFRTVGRRVASVLIAIGLFSAISASVYAARAPISQFISKTYDKYIELFFDQSDVEKAPSTIETVYTLGYVPEGYVEKEYHIDQNSVRITWLNSKDEKIFFEQNILDTNIMIDNEHINYEITYIGDTKIIYSSNSAARYYYWNSNEYCFYLEISNNITHDAAINLIQSLKIKNNGGLL